MPTTNTLTELINNDPAVIAAGNRIVEIQGQLANQLNIYNQAKDNYKKEDAAAFNTNKTFKYKVWKAHIENRDYWEGIMNTAGDYVKQLQGELTRAQEAYEKAKKNVIPPEAAALIEAQTTADTAASNASAQASQATAIQNASDLLQKNAELIKANYAANRTKYLIVAAVILFIGIGFYVLKSKNKI